VRDRSDRKKLDVPNPRDTRTLIAALVDDLKPVRPLPPPWLRCVRSLAAVVVLTGVGVALLGVRFDTRQPLGLVRFGPHLGLELVTGVLAALVAFVLSVPGVPRAPAVRWVPVGVGVGWVLVLTGQLLLARGSTAAVNAGAFAGACFSTVTVVAALPAALLLLVVLRAAPLEPAWSAAFAAAGAAGVAAFATHFHCLNAGPAHALVSHAGPVVALAGIGALGGHLWQRLAATRIRRQIDRGLRRTGRAGA